MSIRKLTIVIDTGDQTCASEPGKFCAFVRVTHFGTKYHCHLFEHETLKEKDGWLQRVQGCLALEELSDLLVKAQ